MSKHQLIPAALREELTEYSSLLRALRTTHTLDLPVHLTDPYANKSDTEEGGPSKSITPAPSTSTSPEVEGGGGSLKRKRSESEPGSLNWRNRDQWTRWPIPVKDVPPPDWSLQDEIGAIVKSLLIVPNSPSVSPDRGSDNHDDYDDTNDMEESPPISIKREQSSSDPIINDSEDEQDTYVHNLAETITPVIRNKLESLFALISAHTIARSDSMQNRIEPFDWRDLINILGSSAAGHLVDETILQTVTTRMEQIFETTPASTSTSVPAPSPPRALHRHTLTKSSRSRLNGLLSKHTSSLFEQSLPPKGHKYLTSYQISARKRKAEERRGKNRRRERAEENIDGEGGGQDVGVQKAKDRGKGKDQGNPKGKLKQKEKSRGKGKKTAETTNDSEQHTEEGGEEEDWESEDEGTLTQLAGEIESQPRS
ncbi:hypothetical protein D9756_008719 [Leucocoprinus leucothites]|uniref:Rrn9 domain-containing protein n=1 Tax=Leucocoprinus leucothites TaxID=201217 RepID=A0A8H5D0V8_9AGAR|nr:hypothetical protein D9756_008719 [Leucoagaricus leucothites]